MTETETADNQGSFAPVLPYLRRYARALTGSQMRGDQYAIATVEAVLSDPKDHPDPRIALFAAFHSIWVTSGASFEQDEDLTTPMMRKLSNLTAGTREALLLHTVEAMSFDEIGAIMDVAPEEARKLVDIAVEEMAKTASAKVMIIEDEPIISIDLEGIVTDMGHRVMGVATTKDEALALAQTERPDLILSDIQLADLSSGMEASAEINAAQGPTPVVFITAYPERLLTGTGPEPAFVIPKPYQEDQVRAALSQAMFFSSMEPVAP